MEYEAFTQERIAKLRTQANLSARDLSLSLGQNLSYINHIENKKSLPSLSALFYICDYLHVTPQEFFDEGNAYPGRLKEVVEDLKKLDGPLFDRIADLINELARKK